MSKLGRAITARATGERAAMHEPVPLTYDALSTYKSICNVGTVYSVGAKFNVDVLVPENVRGAPPLSELVRDAKRQMLHEVFGEYRTPLYEAMRFCRRGLPELAVQVIQSVLQNMENDDPYVYVEPRGWR